ncbi:MAG: AAA domain-containing protein, partial [Umezawaea sp.]
MRAEELTAGDARLIEVRVRSGSGQKWLAQVASKDSKDREIEFRRASPDAAHDLIIYKGNESPVRGELVNPHDLAWLEAAGHVVLVWAAYLLGEVVGLQCQSFLAADLGKWMDIGVGDAVAEQVRIASESKSASFDKVREWLLEEFTLAPASGEPHLRFVHSGGPVDGFEAGLKAFTLHGKRWVADVMFGDNKLQITRMTDASSRGRGRWPRLSTLALRFSDRGEAADATEAIRAALLGLASDGRSYLDLWQAYNDIEREALVDEAKRLKWGVYGGCQVRSDGVWSFELQPGERTESFLGAVAAHSGHLELEAAVDLPVELSGKRGRSSPGVHGVVKRVVKGGMTVELVVGGDEPPPPSGYLFHSLSGDRVRLRRRDMARERIEADQAEIPGLRLLIEGLPRPGARQLPDHGLDRVIAAGVRGVPGAAKPTEVQLDALRLALRTPDVLLVQGPPGTGKTRFITDLLRCLDEFKGKDADRTLISSFQHDAVDNVAGRARRLGLPPTRVSTKPDRDRQAARQWRDETVALVGSRIDAQRPEVARRDRVVKLRQLASAYDQQLVTNPDLAAILGEAKRLAGAELPSPLRGRVERVLARLRVDDRSKLALSLDERAAAARATRSIRASATAFADDGGDRAERALRLLDPVLNDGDRALLHRAAVADVAPESLLAELSELREGLLDRLAGESAVANAPSHDPEVEALLNEIAEAAEQAYSESPDSVDEVLRAYQEDLREDMALVEATLTWYNTVLAATVQQANSLEMSRVLDAAVPVFDTVIVDEAARANPLDLMIPMAFARKRIILVGDHKQLPHSLELKVERELRRNRALEDSELSKSLFERWFELFASEFPAVRTIRLDTQFRMHSALGTFVSSTFYGSPDAIKAHSSTSGLT